MGLEQERIASRFEGWCRRSVFGRLERLKVGRLRVIEGCRQRDFGPGGSLDPHQAEVQVHDPRLYPRLLLGGSVGAGEAYMEGWWTSADPAAVARVIALNGNVFEGLDSALSRPASWLHRLVHRMRRNSRSGSRANIRAHYDLGNEFYRLFLDPGMMYSCAYFPEEGTSLEEASFAKNDMICRKLELKPSDHLLEIGTGWGGFAIHAAERFGCRVTTTTISREQFEFAGRRVRREGLSGRVQVLRNDYRDLEGTYDKLVSIEMIEAVGHQFYDTFFEHCSRLLKPRGLMLLQAITVADQRYRASLGSVDFIKRYIFPGGCLPSVAAICDCLARVTDFRVIGLEDLTRHYARTLAAWRERFLANLDQVRRLGFDERFIRMWDYYLSACQGGFQACWTGDVQMLLAKPRFGVEPAPDGRG